MNKQILLQSIKSVSGFLAILFIGMTVFTYGMTRYPYVTIPTLIIFIFGWMVWMEYNKRSEKFRLDVMKKIKG